MLDSPLSHRPSRRRPARFAACVGGLVLASSVLAGCGSGGGASASSSTTLSDADLARVAKENTAHASTSSASSGLSTAADGSFVVPEAAKAHTQDGAKAFVEFYWRMLGELDKHPRAGVIPKFSTPSCASCLEQEKTGESLSRNGAHLEVGSPELSDFQVRKDSVADQVVVTFHLRDAGGSRVDGTGKRSPVAPNNLLVAARADWVNNQWKIGAAGGDKQ